MLNLIRKLVKTITLGKIVLWSIAAVICIVSFTIYEHRAQLFEKAFSKSTSHQIGSSFSIGQFSQNKLKELVTNDPEIVAVQVISADIRLNLKTVVFHFDNDRLEEFLNPPSRYRSPLLTTHIDRNRMVISLLNGEFNCAPFSVSANFDEELSPRISTVCKASIPPYYGFFTGYISLYLKSQPSVETQLQYKSSLELISTEIYLRDISTIRR